MNMEQMSQVPPANESEIQSMQQQGWDVETSNATQDQMDQIQNELVNAGLEVQVFANPDNETYTILRKTPEEEAAMPADEENPESVASEERDKMAEIFPDLFGQGGNQ